MIKLYYGISIITSFFGITLHYYFLNKKLNKINDILNNLRINKNKNLKKIKKKTQYLYITNNMLDDSEYIIL
jgi:hypothetical protein